MLFELLAQLDVMGVVAGGDQQKPGRQLLPEPAQIDAETSADEGDLSNKPPAVR